MTDPSGVEKVLNYDNIAIVIEFIVIIGLGRYILLLTKGLLAVKDALANVDKTLAILNERLGRHD